MVQGSQLPLGDLFALRLTSPLPELVVFAGEHHAGLDQRLQRGLSAEKCHFYFSTVLLLGQIFCSSRF